MNRSKSAAVLMLLGTFASGAGASYAGSRIIQAQRDRQPECPQPRSESNYRERFAEFLGLDTAQRATIDSLVAARNSAVTEVFSVARARAEIILAEARTKSDSILAGPRARADSIRAATRVRQNAVFTAGQVAKLREWEAQQQEQQARCGMLERSGASRSAQSTKSRANHH